MAENFNNVTGKHKFTGTFIYKELDYEYTLYLPRFNSHERLEVISKFGNRMLADKFGLDINEDVCLNQDRNFLGIICDLTNEKRVKEAIYKTVTKFGGIDISLL